MTCKDIEQQLFSAQQIEKRVEELAAQLTADYGASERPLLLVSVLKGGVVFLCDLMRRLPFALQLEFMKTASYGDGTVSSGQPRLQLDLGISDLSGYSVLIVEDILDSGNTLCYLKQLLTERGAHSVKLCVLLDKPSRRQADITPDYTGFTVDDLFVVGYGLDFRERYRNLPYIGVLRPEIYE